MPGLHSDTELRRKALLVEAFGGHVGVGAGDGQEQGAGLA